MARKSLILLLLLHLTLNQFELFFTQTRNPSTGRDGHWEKGSFFAAAWTCSDLWKTIRLGNMSRLPDINIDDVVPEYRLTTPLKPIKDVGSMLSKFHLVEESSDWLIEAKITFPKPQSSDWKLITVFVMVIATRAVVGTDPRRGLFNFSTGSNYSCLNFADTNGIVRVQSYRDKCGSENADKIYTETLALIRPDDTKFAFSNGIHVIFNIPSPGQYAASETEGGRYMYFFRTVLIFKYLDSATGKLWFPLRILDSQKLPPSELITFSLFARDDRGCAEIRWEKDPAPPVMEALLEGPSKLSPPDPTGELVRGPDESCSGIWLRKLGPEFQPFELSLDDLFLNHYESVQDINVNWNSEAAIKREPSTTLLPTVHMKISFDKPANWEVKALFVMVRTHPSRTHDSRRGLFDFGLSKEGDFSCMAVMKTGDQVVVQADLIDICEEVNQDDPEIVSKTIGIIRPVSTDKAFGNANVIEVLWRVRDLKDHFVDRLFSRNGGTSPDMHVFFRTVAIFKKFDSDGTPHYPIWILDSSHIGVQHLILEYLEGDANDKADCKPVLELRKNRTTLAQMLIGETPDGPFKEIITTTKETTNVLKDEADEHKTYAANIHGTLMITVFMLFFPIAVFIARYFKETCTDEPCFEKEVWWWFHTGLHLVCLVLLISSSILMLITFGFSNSSHAVSGGVAIGLYVILCCTGFITLENDDWHNWLVIAHATGSWIVEIMALALIMFSGHLTAGAMPCFVSAVVILYVITRFVLFVVVGCHFKWLFHLLEVEHTDAALNPCPLAAADCDSQAPATKTRLGLLFTFIFFVFFWSLILILSLHTERFQRQGGQSCNFATEAVDLQGKDERGGKFVD